MSQTVVAKIGTSSITDDHGDIDEAAVAKFCAEVAGLRADGHRVIAVTSGAIAAGLPAIGLGGDLRPSDAVTLQAVSAIGQSRLMRVYDACFADHDVVAGQVLLAPLDFGHRQQYLHARGTLERLLDLGVVPIVNENDAIADDEIRFGDNDRLSALVAHLVGADLLVLLTDAPGLLTADPRLDDQASLIEEVVEVTADLERLAGGAGSAITRSCDSPLISCTEQGGGGDGSRDRHPRARGGGVAPGHRLLDHPCAACRRGPRHPRSPCGGTTLSWRSRHRDRDRCAGAGPAASCPGCSRSVHGDRSGDDPAHAGGNVPAR